MRRLAVYRGRWRSPAASIRMRSVAQGCQESGEVAADGYQMATAFDQKIAAPLPFQANRDDLVGHRDCGHFARRLRPCLGSTRLSREGTSPVGGWNQRATKYVCPVSSR